jgi:hypothetical protein
MIKLLKNDKGEVITFGKNAKQSEMGYILDDVEFQYGAFRTSSFTVEEVPDDYFTKNQ